MIYWVLHKGRDWIRSKKLKRKRAEFILWGLKQRSWMQSLTRGVKPRPIAESPLEGSEGKTSKLHKNSKEANKETELLEWIAVGQRKRIRERIRKAVRARSRLATSSVISDWKGKVRINKARKGKVRQVKNRLAKLYFGCLPSPKLRFSQRTVNHEKVLNNRSSEGVRSNNQLTAILNNSWLIVETHAFTWLIVQTRAFGWN